MMAKDGNYWLCFRSFYYDEKSVELGSLKEDYGPFCFDDVLGLFDKFNRSFICKIIADRYLSKFYDRVSMYVRKCNLKIFVTEDFKNVAFNDLIVEEDVKYDPYLEEDDDLPF